MAVTTFIGGGNMATALVGRMLARGTPAGTIRVVEPVAAQREKLAARFPGVLSFPDASAAALGAADLVVFAVKPQQMREAARAAAPHLAAHAVVLSIAAGTRVADLSRWLGGFARIVRAMPNTPALVGKGISGVFAPAAVDAAGRERAEAVVAAAGEIVRVDDEAMLDAVTGVSGSGPAYVFYFLEALETAARELGFSREDARRLAYATFDGAIALAKASPEEPATLRAQVTSKGGTTERGIGAMDAGEVKRKIVAAAKAAAARAGELAADAGRD